MSPPTSSPHLSTTKKAIFSLAFLVFLLVVVEVALRLCGVVFYPQAVTLPPEDDREVADVQLVPDGQVQWVVAPNTLAGTPLAINAHGMRGPEVTVDKPPGTLRVLCMGDSCTFGARSEKPYPVLLEELCNRRLACRVEVLNGAVPGHAAHQGTAMLERYAKFSPDVVTVYFGWNDHWRRTAALSGPKLPEPPATDHVLILRGLRLAYRKWVARAAVRRQEEIIEMKESPLRLPPTHYGAMLDEFAVLGGRYGFDLVYLTAPSAFTPKNLRWIVEQRGWAARAEEAVALHERYNEISREMAGKKNATLVDLDRIFRKHDEPLLHADGIHLSQEGHAIVAEELFEAVKPLLERRSRSTEVSSPVPGGSPTRRDYRGNSSGP